MNRLVIRTLSLYPPVSGYLVSAGFGLSLLGGCTVGPDYRPPTVSSPSQWSEPMLGGETNSPASIALWWNQFNDPELNSLIERAVKSNLDLKIAGSRVLEARAEYQVASAEFWPDIGTTDSYQRQRQSRNQPLLGPLLPASVPLENNVYQAGFDASWELDVFGGARRSTEAARAEIAAAEFNRSDTLITLLAEVARDYVEARGYQQQLGIAQENIKAQEQSLAITQLRFTNGLAPNLDVQQAQTLLSTTRSEIPSLESDLESAVHRLGVLLALPPGALSEELASSAPIPAAEPKVPVGLPSQLLQRRPDVKEAERELAAATARIGVATADLFPKFSLTGAAGFQSVSAGDWFTGASKFWSLGPTAQWNIFDAGRIHANIRVQNARQERALDNYEKAALSAFEDVENALVRYAKEQTRQRSLEDAVKSSRESAQAANQLYANGLVSFINVLDAERSLYQVQNEVVKSHVAISADLISLYKALGGGWNADVKLAQTSSQ